MKNEIIGIIVLIIIFVSLLLVKKVKAKSLLSNQLRTSLIYVHRPSISLTVETLFKFLSSLSRLSFPNLKEYPDE